MTRILLAGTLAIACIAASAAPLAAAPTPEPARPLTEDMCRTVVLNWYAITNEHRPIEDLLTLADPDIQFRYPDTAGQQSGHQALRDWYAAILLTAFDETHEVERWESIVIDGDRATLSLIVRWERRTWEPGAARSRYLANLAWQTYELQRDPATGAIRVTAKTVDRFEPTAPIYGVDR